MSSTPNNTTGGAGAAAPARGETALLAKVQSDLLKIPVATPVSTTLSHVGEHALGWMAIAAAGAVFQPARRTQWISAGTAAFGAHAASVVIKRIVRRRRPHHPSIAVGVKTPSALSFPSSHATSTTAFALLAGQATGIPGAAVAVPAVLVPLMAASRLVLGVHYPTDVTAGIVLGAGSAAAATVLVPQALDRAGQHAGWVTNLKSAKDAQ